MIKNKKERIFTANMKQFNYALMHTELLKTNKKKANLTEKKLEKSMNE